MSEELNYISCENDRLWCLKNNVRITYPGKWDYPESFAQLPLRPGVLFYIGQPVWKSHRLISVVGSRSPQASSMTWLEDHLSDLLTKIDVAIVSGGARGIDQKAHQISLQSERPTVAFLPSGLRSVYPSEFTDWVSEIVKAGGCVVSQFQPSYFMQKRFFRERNFLIAAISELTLIVECRRRSGTMLTAKNCILLDKKLAVMPTYPSAAGLGGLDLICDSGAIPVRDALDLFLAMGHASQLINAVK